MIAIGNLNTVLVVFNDGPRQELTFSDMFRQAFPEAVHPLYFLIRASIFMLSYGTSKGDDLFFYSGELRPLEAQTLFDAMKGFLES